ncbi:MAG: hypothetical protein K6B41_09520, partial [Butyrivibrio sp.]|nr:hypothetical protein [Butyrivibrio sp.]
MTKKLLLIDCYSVLERSFYGLPDLTNSKGIHTGAVYGFLNLFFKYLHNEKPDYVIAAFGDSKAFSCEDKYPESFCSQIDILKDI